MSLRYLMYTEEHFFSDLADVRRHVFSFQSNENAAQKLCPPPEQFTFTNIELHVHAIAKHSR